MHLAALKGHLDIARLLLKCGADRNIRDGQNRTPFDLASDNMRLEVANFLSRSALSLDGEVNPTASSTNLQNQRPDVVQSPRPYGEKAGSSNDRQASKSVCAASENGQIDIVRALLDHGSDVEERNSLRRTALAVASMYGQLEVATLLIERGANVNARDADGWTPLLHASKYEKLSKEIFEREKLPIVRLLLDHNADLNAGERDQRTALHLASRFGFLEIAQLLLERGANPNVRNIYGRTPRQDALAYGFGGIAELLSKHGAI